jgi:hypothetical protein
MTRDAGSWWIRWNVSTVVVAVVLDVPILWRVVRHVEHVELGLLAFRMIDKDATHLDTPFSCSDFGCNLYIKGSKV